MDWTDFTTRLGRILRDFPERTYLIVEQAATGVYVQYAATGTDLVSAECVSNKSGALTERLDHDGELRLVGLGWTPYSDADFNWSTSLQLPATLADASRLAEISLAALRDVYSVDSPERLTYVAWRDADPAPPKWGEPSDPGENPLVIPELGLPPTSA